jgi:hypothetical protein
MAVAYVDEDGRVVRIEYPGFSYQGGYVAELVDNK